MSRLTNTRLSSLLIFFFLIGSGNAKAFAADAAGYALVERLIAFFNETAASRVARYDTINQNITEMMAQAKAAKAEGRIDREFFDRYTRVLRLFKLRITEDKEGILQPITDWEYTSFVRDVTGKPYPGVPTIATLSQAVTQELANLKKQLDQKP